MRKCGVIGLVFNEDRTKILLIKRRDVTIWVLPGGGVEPGETLENAIVREIQEETHLTVSIVNKIGEYTPVNRLTHSTHLFECKSLKGNLAHSEEACEVAFFPLNGLPEPLFHIHQNWINEALKPREGPFIKPLVEVSFWELTKYFCFHPLRTLRFMLSRLGFPLNTSQK